MTSCAKILPWLPGFVGDDLDADRTAAVREHLHTCVGCRREASSLQQAHQALQRLGPAAAPGVDEAWFAELQRDIVDRVGRAAERDGPRWRDALRWPVSAAAAAALFLCGWWLVRDGGPESLLQRPPIATTVGHSGAAKAVPWSGQRVQVQQLGDEGGVENGVGPGMMGRYRLRTLEGHEWPAGWPLPEDRPQAGAGAPPEPVRSGRGR